MRHTDPDREPIDRLVFQALPRAPRGFAAAVISAHETCKQRRRGRQRLAVAGVALALTASIVLVLREARPTSPAIVADVLETAPPRQRPERSAAAVVVPESEAPVAVPPRVSEADESIAVTPAPARATAPAPGPRSSPTPGLDPPSSPARVGRASDVQPTPQAPMRAEAFGPLTLTQRFAAEPRRDRWAEAVENALRGWWSIDLSPWGAFLGNAAIECRSSVCKLELSHAGDEDRTRLENVLAVIYRDPERLWLPTGAALFVRWPDGDLESWRRRLLADREAHADEMRTNALAFGGPLFGDPLSWASSADREPERPAQKLGPGRHPCTQTSDPGTVVYTACSEGGVLQAKAVMKKIVRAARVHQLRIACDHCHGDDDWQLSDPPLNRARLRRLLEFIDGR